MHFWVDIVPTPVEVPFYPALLACLRNLFVAARITDGACD